MMNYLYRASRIWSAINETNALGPVFTRRLAINKIQQGRACFYCKKYGLYDDEEEESVGEFNKRGAYINHRGPKFEKLERTFNEDPFMDDEDFPSHNQNRRMFQSRNNAFTPRRKYGALDDVDDSYNDDNRGSRQTNSRFGYNSRNYGQRSGFKYGGFDSDRNHPFNRYQNRNMNPFYQRGETPKTKTSADPANLTPFEKNFYSEHADVVARSPEDIEKFKESMNITIQGTNVPHPIMNFGELTVSETLLQIVKSQNFSAPTAIQSQGWPIALSGRDMIGISQTGSGKTLVFALPAMVHVMNQKKVEPLGNECFPQALVMAPTRELAHQIYDVCDKFRHYCGIRSACIYGGASKIPQYEHLRTSQVCIATPGRLLDFLQEGAINLQHCTYLVLDEADRMLDMGFEPQIRQIIDQMRPDRQTLMWSATWPTEVRMLAEDFLNDYIQVTIGNDQLTANPNITQNIIVVNEHDKEKKLFALLNSIEKKQSSKVLIFAQTKKTVDFLSRRLNNIGIFAMAIHGNVSQAGRNRVLTNFRNQTSSILVATDVAARGLDVSDIHHVINYDFPTNIEDYIHRIGRTARGSKTGTAHSFVTDEDAGITQDLIKVLFQVGQVPSQELLEMSKRRRMSKTQSRYARNRPQQQFSY